MSSISTEPGARPLRADAVRNRIRVLDAALAVFAEAGPDAQMEDIARRAGVGVGTLYRHFPTKEALAEAVLERHLDGLERFIREECATDPDPWAGLVRVFRNAATSQLGNRGLSEALVDMTDQVPKSCSHQRRLGPLTGEILGRAQKAGAARPDLVEKDLYGLFAGLSAVIGSGGDWERYLDIVLAGLRA